MSEDGGYLRILGLHVENVKGVKVVDMKLDENENLVVIGGANGTGKTSVIDSIMYALGGKKAVPAQPIRQGEDEAVIELDLGDLIVTRKITQKTDRLTVKSKEGANYPSPQAILDKMVGRLSFNPLAFAKLSGTAAGRREQAQLVMDLADLDFTDHDAERKIAFDNRTDVNRDLKKSEVAFKGAPHHEGAPSEEVSITAVAEELDKARRQNSDLADAKGQLRDVQGARDSLAAQKERIETEIAALDIRLAEQSKELAGREPRETGSIETRLANAEADNVKVRANAEREKLREEVKWLTKKADDLTEQIKDFDGEKAMKIAQARLPVKCLGFTEDGLTLNDLPFEQASASEQLRTSVAMGVAMNPTLRVMLIDQGSELDKDNLAAIGEIAKEADTQVWIVRVSEGDECSVIMEAGRIREDENDG